MRSIYTCSLLVLLSVSATNLYAAEPAQEQIMNPTLAYFVALNSCKAGDYQEKNIMTDIVGPATLQHRIDGYDIYGDCVATLETPDGRTLECIFIQSDLNKLADQHFMTGMLTATKDDPGRAAIRSDQIWTQMKADNCRFVGG